MYICKNCGQPYTTDEAVICVKCGVAKGLGSNYCHHCGNAINPEAEVCLTCGVPCKPQGESGRKSKIAAGLLAIFLGQLGIHNFYLGYTKKAITQLVLTIVGYITACIVIGGFIVLGTSIWGLVEGIMIFVGKIDVDGNGVPLSD